jgi:hypothetical protein
MKGSNVTKAERARRNKEAFDQVIGDPYQVEPVVGHYLALQSQSSIQVQDLDKPQAGSVNQARPNIMDFLIDVDAAVADGLDQIGIQLGAKFNNTYRYEDDDKPKFTQDERAKLEQIIGRILIARSISPIGKYFQTIRK